MKKSSDKIALFDLDQTLADYDASMERCLAEIANPNEPLYDYHDIVPDWYLARIRMVRNVPGWWEELATRVLGFDILRVARRIGFENHVLTKGPTSTAAAWTEKVRWCRKHLTDDILVTITENKSMVYGRVLVDDYEGYALEWLDKHARGLVIMPATGQNGHVQHDRLIRYDGSNITAVERAMQLAFDREPRQAVNFKE